MRCFPFIFVEVVLFYYHRSHHNDCSCFVHFFLIFCKSDNVFEDREFFRWCVCGSAPPLSPFFDRYTLFFGTFLVENTHTVPQSDHKPKRYYYTQCQRILRKKKILPCTTGYDDDFNTIQIIHTQTKHTFTHTQHGRGLMEVPRMLLAVASEFPPTDYEDLRYTTDKVIEKDDPRLPFSSVASSLTKNLGRLPVISTESWTCGQSGSINVYVAATRDLMGEKGNWKEFCDVLTVQVRFFSSSSSSLKQQQQQQQQQQESIKEMNQAYRKLIPYVVLEPEAREFESYLSNTTTLYHSLVS